MAKVRVYELAKELSMDSKELVEKLKAGGIPVKNYMSTLDEQTVAKAREVALGVVSEVIEEKRIRPTVIRRRKKTVTVEAEKVPEKVEPAVAEAAPKAPVVEAPKPPVEERPAAAARAPAARVRHEVKAEVIEEAGGEEPAEEAEEEPVVEAKEERLVEMETAAAAGQGATVEPMKAVEAIETPKAQVLDAEKIKEKLKKPKKKKLDQPAKIIRRAEDSPLKPVLEKKREEAAPVEERVSFKPPAAEHEAVVPDEEKERRGKKKKEKKGVGREEETPRSVIRLRKFEVFERADLYEGRLVKRKKKEAPGKEVPKRMKQPELVAPKPAKRKIKIPEKVTVADLAKAMSVKAAELIRKLMALGMVANINQTIDYETASLLAEDSGYELEEARFELEESLTEVVDKPEELKSRPPVVTIMGHVDHGKTSLLDYIRKSNIIAGESGGITQHIGAYYVERSGGDIVFLDTPGHEAFTAMRARGAKVTDIIVLVVAADDGVMPQTKEAINHGRAANIPIVVAINKIDKPEANVERVRRELAELGLAPEEWGGQTIFGSISAKTGQGVDELLELILLQAEVLELKANPEKPARGTVIEAKLDKSRGPVATVLIRNGTLKQGSYFICGEHFGKVRAMLNNRGKRMIVATPSMPVEVYGISGVPMAGDEFIVVPDEKTAKEVIEYRLTQSKKWEGEKRGIVSLDDLFQKIKEGEVKELNLVLKADVQGSIEAISDSLAKLTSEEVKLKIIHSSTGAISETDVMLASASEAIIIGFNVRANPRVTELAEKEKVDIRYYDVIYNLIQDIKLAMAGLLAPILKENFIGRASVKEVFHIPKVGIVAGCTVTDGRVERNAQARLLRDEVVVFEGKIASLRRFKDDVKEVQTGYECGITLENFQDIKPGDVFEVYQVEEIRPEL
ncbi:MAG TPA: translation initiation factor IF-2 [Desulfatiglandales bacterium]|nr:translation initiation factor IF-2 [Desulfatiglandales bacterium]